MAAGRSHTAPRTLDLDEILQDEYAALYPSSGVASVLPDSPARYAFTDAHVRDIKSLAHLICDGAVPVVNPSPTRAALLVIAHGQDALVAAAIATVTGSAGTGDRTFVGLLVARLNALLAGDLVTDRRFQDLRLFAGVVAADAEAGRRPRANRLLLEAALAPAVARLRDVHIAALHARVRPYAPTALCLSGGGIRSCTFALGVVTALARHGLLGKFDYLSTVSGGGYLGGWLSAWMMHDGAGTVQRRLAGHSGTTLDPDPQPLRHLRSYSSFLAPRLGLLSADTWTLVATLIRNMLLNWLVLLPILSGVIMLPRAAVSFLRAGEQGSPAAGALPIVLVAAGTALTIAALVYIWRQRQRAVERGESPDASVLSSVAERTQRAFVWRCLTPLVGGALAFSLAWWMMRVRQAARPLALANDPLLRETLNLPPELLGPRLVVALGVPLILLFMLVAGQLLIGFSGGRAGNGDREWNARFSGWLLIVIFTWVSVCTIVLFLPPLLENGWRDPRLLGLHAIGGLSGVIAAFLGASATTPATGSQAAADSSWSSFARRVGLAMSAPVFAVSLIAVISVFNAQVLLRGICAAAPTQCAPALTMSVADLQLREEHLGDFVPAAWVLLMSLGLMAAGWTIGRFVDTNQFSLHAMYRTRLVRTFLGASRANADRAPDPFTGFDEKDDVPMAALWPPAGPPGDRRDRTPPLHVVNVTLNLVARRSLAWQERKAESMTVSSLHAGGPFLGYRPTRPAVGMDQGRDGVYGGRHGISLGTAITISGAAASPEAGYNSSPFISFLMALFNARLGCWLGNPGAPGDRSFRRSGPRGGITPVLSEMFGMTTDESDFVFLSDGGHFDNLGLYSMVLRRCRMIVVSDAGCDPHRTFDDLGNAIRKIRIDLGVPIEFDTDQPAQGEGAPPTATAPRGWAVGRIRYSQVDRPPDSAESDADYDGVIVYIKPTLCGAEPIDVVNYAHRSATFPHETTTNQFFTESQFESYRALGICQGERMCEALGLGTSDASIPDAALLHSAPMRWLEQQRTTADVAV